jgi:hypothetical protein
MTKRKAGRPPKGDKSPGQVIGGMEIVECLNPELPHHENTLYKVRCATCRHEAVNKLGWLTQRQRRGTVYCKECPERWENVSAKLKRQGETRRERKRLNIKTDPFFDYSRPDPHRQAYGITPPTWPVPSVVLEEMRRSA